MLKEHKTKVNIGIGAGILAQITALLILFIGGGSPVAWPILVMGLAICAWACYWYSKSKGHHGAWTLLGLNGVLPGFLVLILLPDKHKGQNWAVWRVVLVIVAFLGFNSFFLAPFVSARQSAARRELVPPQMAILEIAIESFATDCGRYPSTAEGLQALLIAPAGVEEKWKGPYATSSQIIDPWGNPYEYVAEGKINPGSYDLISYGADGEPGGEGNNEDLFNE